MNVTRQEIGEEMASLQKQRAECVETLQRLDGALALCRHLADKCCAKQQAAKAAEEAGGDSPPPS